MMVEWIERVDRGTDPVIFQEHVLRYSFAAPLIQGSSLWADLGCGTGAAAADALQGRFAGRLVLVDKDAAALAAAAREFDSNEPISVEADLADTLGFGRVEDALLKNDSEGRRCITCFEVIEHLDDFGPLIGRLVELADASTCTVALSVPNDAFSGVDNPYHRTVWGEASVEELRSLLPQSQLVGFQYPLTGSSIELANASQQEVTVESPEERVPSHYLIVFGPRAPEVVPVAGVRRLDLDERRAWEQRLNADLDYYRQLADGLPGRPSAGEHAEN